MCMCGESFPRNFTIVSSFVHLSNYDFHGFLENVFDLFFVFLVDAKRPQNMMMGIVTHGIYRQKKKNWNSSNTFTAAYDTICPLPFTLNIGVCIGYVRTYLNGSYLVLDLYVCVFVYARTYNACVLVKCTLLRISQGELLSTNSANCGDYSDREEPLCKRSL